MTAGRFTLVSCLRNEGGFLLEWLAFHRAIGFDRIIVGANDCTDGSDRMLETLAAQGLCEYWPVDVDPALGPQMSFARDLKRRTPFAAGDWVTWLDLDEFLNIHDGAGRVGDLARAIGPADGIRINWRIFGAGREVTWPGRQIHPDLCRCAPVDAPGPSDRRGQRTIKSFYRWADGMRPWHHGPELPIPLVEAGPVWLDGSGREIRRRRGEPRTCGTYADHRLAAIDRPPAYGLAQINHYMTRHPDLVAWRQSRGRGNNDLPGQDTATGRAEYRDRHSPEFAEAYNDTRDEDRSILRHLPALDASLAPLMADPELRRLHEAALAAAFAAGAAGAGRS